MKIDRTTLIENLADHMSNTADYDTLLQYYYEGTIDFLSDLSDDELLDQADWVGYTTEDEDADPGDLDGDHESGLASAGFGTDEDYM